MTKYQEERSPIGIYIIGTAIVTSFIAAYSAYKWGERDERIIQEENRKMEGFEYNKGDYEFFETHGTQYLQINQKEGYILMMDNDEDENIDRLIANIDRQEVDIVKRGEKIKTTGRIRNAEETFRQGNKRFKEFKKVESIEAKLKEYQENGPEVIIPSF